jgi:hypothetical protein
MKKAQIELGKIYHNGKERWYYQERRVIDVGPHLLLYSGQENPDVFGIR